MQSMSSMGRPATSSGSLRTISPGSLASAFARVPDPRRSASVTYSLPAMLSLALAAILANHCSVLAIAEWGARQHRDLVAALGFPDGQTPCQSTLQRLFSKLDGATLSARCWAPTSPFPRPRLLTPRASMESPSTAKRSVDASSTTLAAAWSMRCRPSATSRVSSWRMSPSSMAPTSPKPN